MDGISEEVERLLNSVGKNTFLMFYTHLRDNIDLTVEDMQKILDKKYLKLWNSDSWNTKLSKAKTILRNNFTSDALYLCAKSAKRWSYLDD